jgi:aspartyl-tRNA(Asn)/glutamyl-tRNA(Gln) amidotransferase subunit A
MTLPNQTLQQMANALASGTTTSRALTELALDAATHSAQAQATFMAVHTEQARASADASDRLRAAGVPMGPLAGLPISIKDLFDESGQTTRAGSRVLNDAAPAGKDSLVVQRLRAAGAVVVGRTNMTEFAYSGLGLNPHYGTPLNPWDRATGRIPGGSSSGAAVSVTDGMAAAAIGTDTGGSVRIPSALCGLTGFKPTARRVPMEGVLPLSPSLDSIGPLARSVACCALLHAVLAAESPAPATVQRQSLAGLRVALPRTLVFDSADVTVSSTFAAACSALSAAGVQVVEVDVPEFLELAHINRGGGFTAAEAWAWHAALLQSRETEYDPRVAVRIRRGSALSAADYIELLAARQRWVRAVEQRLAAVNAAFMVFPTVPVVAPAVAPLLASDETYGSTNLLMLRNPTLINFLDGCALSLPCHRPGDAPVGLTLAAPGGHDQAVLAVGAAMEAVLQAHN